MKIVDTHNSKHYTDRNGIAWGPWINTLRTPLPTRYEIPTTRVSFNMFNDYYDSISRREKMTQGTFGDYGIFVLTRKNHISTKTPIRHINYYKLHSYGNFVELYINDERGSCIIQFRNDKFSDNDDAIIIKRPSGARSLKLLTNELKKDGINLNEYAIPFEEGMSLHDEDLKKYPRLIKVLDDTLLNQTLEDVHHLDINSAYPAGVANSFPEMYPTLNRLYEQRHINEDYKDILNLSIGMMESRYIDFKYQHIATSAHKYTNDKIYEMTRYLESTGRKVILYNTDGIWYQGKHLEIAESHLGGWKSDHKHCTFRMKSRGTYEYIEDGIYTPVIRGNPVLAKVKPKSEWEWGDIYLPEAKQVYVIKVVDDLDNSVGLIKLIKEENDI